jgi:UDP-3-O-[3-hydroxymyristoyl] N-acetylglucosamine deacetylase
MGVTNTARGTTLSGEGGASVHTVEHLLSAIKGLFLDNLTIEIDSEEVPIMDGSAEPFYKGLEACGAVDQGKVIQPLRVTELFEMSFGDIHLKAEPADNP